MGAASRKSAASDAEANAVSELAPDQTQVEQAAAQSAAEAANEKLKAKRRGDTARTDTGDGNDTGGAAGAGNRRKKKGGEAGDAAPSGKRQTTEPKWHKPSAAAVTAALASSDDIDGGEIETIAVDHSFATNGGAGGGSKRSSDGTGLANPWARPNPIFTRDFADESRKAELFVQLARQASMAVEKDRGAKSKSKSKGSIIAATAKAQPRDDAAATAQTSRGHETTASDEDDEFDR